MADWKIRRKQGVCTGCERPFEESERHASLLRADAEGLAREDLCPACWAAHAPDRDDLFWWFTRFTTTRKRSLHLDIASLERLFFELEGRAEPKLCEIRYLLCLLLMRKRRLRLERVQRGRAGEALIVRRPRRRDEHVVLVFDFAPERIDALRGELLEILDGSGPDSGADSGAAAEGEVGDELGLDEAEPQPSDPTRADAAEAVPAS